MNIVVMATGAFAVPSIKALYESGLFDIAGLVTLPERLDKNKKPIVTPARQIAKQYGINVHGYEDVNTSQFFEFLYLARPDLIFVCDFGQILSKKTLSCSILGGINLHGSLLPKFRGAAPVHWAILTGESHTGVSIIHMTPQIDAGPVIAQSPPIPIAPHETVVELEERLAEYGAQLVLNTAKKMALSEMVRIIPQFQGRITQAPRLKKEDGFVPWHRSSLEIFNHHRATVEWPRSYTVWLRKDAAPLRLILGNMTPLDHSLTPLVHKDFSQAVFVPPVLTDAKMDNLANLKEATKNSHGKSGSSHAHRQHHLQRPSWWDPGIVIHAEEGELIVAAGEGAVRIEQVQPAGKRMMSVREFLRGYPIKQGDLLGGTK